MSGKLPPEEKHARKLAQQAHYRSINRKRLTTAQRERKAAKRLDPAYREQQNAYNVQWRKNNPDKTKAVTQRTYAKNKEKIAARNKAWRQAHADRTRELDRAWKKAHPEKTRLSHALWRQKNLETLRKKKSAWRQENPDKIRIYNHTERTSRLTHKRDASRNDLTHEQWLAIQSSQDHCCAYCGKRCKGHLTQDHITPVSQGGSHTLHNVIGACKSCNCRKYNKPAPILVQPLLL